MTPDLSREALLKFLDYLAEKGLMNRATAQARKAATNRVLGILGDDAVKDVSALDIDEIMLRFGHLQGDNYKPESLQVYKSRVKAAIDDFVRFKENPEGFRASIPQQRRSPSGTQKGPKPASNGKTDAKQAPGSQPDEPPPAARIDVLPIPIRQDVVVQISGLPYDLSPTEAAKIANVVKAMANTDS